MVEPPFWAALPFISVVITSAILIVKQSPEADACL